MLIHNWFSDILLSSQIMLDNIIFADKKIFKNNFPEYFIKHYEFSLANRTFVVGNDKFKTGFEYPTCLVTLGEDSYIFNERPNVIQYTTLPNVNQIPVLYDTTSKTIINLQEEQTTIAIQLQINCESQLQAKEVDFTIKRYLPIGKYIHLIEFTSWLEISSEIMLSLGMDFNHNEILNLFTRINHNTGNIGHFFSVRYKPLIKLESITSSSTDISQRSFPVNVEMSYLIQQPIWLFSEKYRIIENINVDFVSFGKEPISFNSCKGINGNTKNVRMNLVISSLEEFGLKNNDENIISIKFNKREFKFTSDMYFDIIDIYGNRHKDVKIVDNNSIEENIIRFKFSEDEINKYYNATITSPIILQIIEKII